LLEVGPAACARTKQAHFVELVAARALGRHRCDGLLHRRGCDAGGIGAVPRVVRERRAMSSDWMRLRKWRCAPGRVPSCAHSARAGCSRVGASGMISFRDPHRRILAPFGAKLLEGPPQQMATARRFVS
jgi:hypothetical protein